jgi:hypothetical protein
MSNKRKIVIEELEIMYKEVIVTCSLVMSKDGERFQPGKLAINPRFEGDLSQIRSENFNYSSEKFCKMNDSSFTWNIYIYIYSSNLSKSFLI